MDNFMAQAMILSPYLLLVCPSKPTANFQFCAAHLLHFNYVVLKKHLEILHIPTL